MSWSTFVGFPVETGPRFLVLVGIETTAPGGVAAPSFARVLSSLLNPPRTGY